MILINLLPHREAAKKRRKEQFFVMLAVAACVGLLLAFLYSYYLSIQIDTQRMRNQILVDATKKLELQIKDIASLQTEMAALKARQQAVEDLQADRNLPVHILSDLATFIPEGIYLTSLKQAGLSLTLTGMAQSQERVSELLRNFSGKSQWLTKPELVEIISTPVSLNPKEQKKKVFSFQLKLTISRQKDASEVVTTVK
jgi:type IV pilus assembly protein PilN